MNEETIQQLRDLYRDTLIEFKQNAGFEDQDYWQGRKDAMRLCLTLILPELEDNLRTLLETSPNYIPVESELIQDLLDDAVYNVAAIVYEIEELPRVDGRTLLNLKNFVRRYDYLAKQGKFKIITDHCLS